MRSFGRFCALCLVLCAACAEASTTNTSNAVAVKGWKRDLLTFDTESNRFSRAEFPTLAEAETAAELAEELPGLYVAATNALMTNLAPVYVATTNHKAKTVVALTGAASLDNLLDRQNLTMAVVSNEVTRNANGTRSVRAWVAENFVTKSPPVMKARLRTIGGADEWINAEWADGWTNATTITLVHPQSYTNFVVATVTNEATVVLTTNVVFSVIEDAYRPVVVTNKLEYDGVEYLQSSGTQYIALDFCPASENVVAECCVYTDSNGDYNILGSYCTTVPSGKYGIVGRSYPLAVYNGNFFCGVPNENIGLTDGLAPCLSSWHLLKSVCKSGDIRIYVDGELKRTSTKTFSTMANGVNYLLFARHSYYGGTDYRVTCIINAKIKFVKIEDDDLLELNLLPVLHEGEGKMLDLCHNTLYANAGSGAFTYGAVTGTVYGAEYTSTNYVHYCVTNSETRAITLTNQVIVVTDGTIPRIVTKGDREELQCHPLDYTIPATAVPPDLSRWVRIGHPDTGFDFGNRALRVNGVTTLTTNDLNFLGDFMVYTNGVPVSVTNDFTFFADNGLLKVAERSTNTVSGVNL